MIYQHRDTIKASGGSTSTMTLPVIHGLLRHFVIQANTSSTVFRANVTDYKGYRILSYGFATGEINDTGIAVPVQEQYTLSITNASPDDTFKLYYAVEE